MRIVTETLNRMKIGAPASFANLTLFPLIGSEGREPDYATLDEALRQGWLEVGEVSRAGSVPELKVSNRGDRAVLLMDGEELVGAKQNRVLNLTILVPAGATLIVPVSCVEQGRWAMSNAAMSSSRDTLYARARLDKLCSVSAGYARAGRAMSDQGALWREIGQKAREMGVASDTMAMKDIFDDSRRRIDDYVKAFRTVEGQSGAMFAIGERLVGFELFEHPDVLGKMFEKVVRSYALDAIQARPSDNVPSEKAAREFLLDVAKGTAQEFAAVGLGTDLRISGPNVTGAALIDGDHLVHLCAFRTEGGGAGRVMSASDRMRRSGR